MTDPNQRPTGFDDSPTQPTQQTSFVPGPPTMPAPPSGPQPGPATAPPNAWQPAGWTGAPESDPIIWTPAGQAPEAPKRGGKGRWLVALLGALIIIVATAGVAVFALGSKSSASLGPTFLPANTPIYAEVRLDLPGTQRDNVIKLLSHFPGFSDPSAFDQKIDDVFNKQIANLSSNQISYTNDIKPWFGGQIAIGVLDVPKVTTLMAPGTDGAAAGAAETPVVIGISIKDRSHLDTLLTTVRALGGGYTFSQEQYGDHAVVTVSQGDKPTLAYTVSDKLMLLAQTSANLKTSLDVVDGKAPSLAADDAFKSVAADLPTDRLGAVYLAPAVFQMGADSLHSMMGAGMGAGAGTAPTMTLGALQCLVPAMPDPAKVRLAVAIVANGDSLAIQSSSEGLPDSPARTATDLAAHVPADSLIYAELPKAGGSLHDIVACLRTTNPEVFADDQVKQIEKALGTSLEDYLSFVTDVGVSISYDGTTFHWGLVAAVDNEDTAKSRVTSLLAYAKLAAGLGGAPISVSEQQAGGTTVTTITVSNTPALQNMPIDPSISVAVSGGHLYVGGGDFAAKAVALTEAELLAGSQRYSSALTAAGNPNGVILYADVDGIRQRAEAAMTASGSLNQDYTTNTQPFVKPFDRLIIGRNQDKDGDSSHILVFVK